MAPSRSRLYRAVEEAMRAVPNLAVEADEQTIGDFAAELRERGIVEAERRGATKGTVTLGAHVIHQLGEAANQPYTSTVDLKVAQLDGIAVVIAEIEREEVSQRSFYRDRYVLTRDGMVKL